MYLPVRSFSACVNSGSRIAPYGPRQVVAGCPIHGVLANYLGLHALSHRRRRSSYCRDVRDCLSRPIAHQSFVHTKRKIKSVFSVLLQLTTWYCSSRLLLSAVASAGAVDRWDRQTDWQTDAVPLQRLHWPRRRCVLYWNEADMRDWLTNPHAMLDTSQLSCTQPTGFSINYNYYCHECRLQWH